MAHRYFVDWSAPDYHKSGLTTVMADNQPEAIKKAKKKLGDRVKKQYLANFRAWRDEGPTMKARWLRNTRAEEQDRPRYSIHR